MAEDMFDGFDHTQYREEVERRWGADAYAKGNAWWTSMSAEEQTAWKTELSQLNVDWADAATRGIDPASDEAQALAERHIAWLSRIPGTPEASREYVLGLGEMYVADDRFAQNYGGAQGATFVRDALQAHYA